MEEVGTIDVVDELVSFAWSVDWSQCLTKKCGEFMISPTFSTLSDEGKVLEWQLQLYPDGVNRKCRGCVSLYLQTMEEKVVLQKVVLQKVVYFFLLNGQDGEVNKVYGEPYPEFKRAVCGLDRFIRRDSFEHNVANFLNYGKLTVVCTVADIRTEPRFRSSRSTVKVPAPPLPARRKSLGSLIDDDGGDEANDARKESVRSRPIEPFEAMLESGESDVCLVVGDRSFCAHRAILTARSSHFRATFEEDIAQGKQVSFLDTSEFSADVVLEILRYIYLDAVDKLEERASLLLAAANKFNLDKLKAQCEEIMIRELSVENASEYLVLSFLHEASGLQEKAMDFVVGHSLDVVNTPGFKVIAGSHANVIAAILKTIAVRSKN